MSRRSEAVEVEGSGGWGLTFPAWKDYYKFLTQHKKRRANEKEPSAPRSTSRTPDAETISQLKDTVRRVYRGECRLCRRRVFSDQARVVEEGKYFHEQCLKHAESRKPEQIVIEPAALQTASKMDFEEGAARVTFGECCGASTGSGEAAVEKTKAFVSQNISKLGIVRSSPVPDLGDSMQKEKPSTNYLIGIIQILERLVMYVTNAA
jgi:hypothetical protein